MVPVSNKIWPIHLIRVDHIDMKNRAIDLTERARKGQLPEILGFARILEDLIVDCMGCTGLNSNKIIILEGPNGIGKSALIEALAKKLALEEAFPDIQQMPVWLVDYAEMIRPATNYLEKTAAIYGVLKALAETAKNIVVVFDKFAEGLDLPDEFQFVSGTPNSRSCKAAVEELEIIKSAIESIFYREKGCILICTSDSEICRRMRYGTRHEEIRLKEPNRVLTAVLNRESQLIERFGILCSFRAAEAAVTLSNTFLKGPAQPGNAINLLDRAVRRIVASFTQPFDIEFYVRKSGLSPDAVRKQKEKELALIEEARSILPQLERHEEVKSSNSAVRQSSTVTNNYSALNDRFKKLRDEFRQIENPIFRFLIDDQDIIDEVAIMLGVSSARIKADFKSALNSAGDALNRVFSDDSEVAELIQLSLFDMESVCKTLMERARDGECDTSLGLRSASTVNRFFPSFLFIGYPEERVLKCMQIISDLLYVDSNRWVSVPATRDGERILKLKMLDRSDRGIGILDVRPSDEMELSWLHSLIESGYLEAFPFDQINFERCVLIVSAPMGGFSERFKLAFSRVFEAAKPQK